MLERAYYNTSMICYNCHWTTTVRLQNISAHGGDALDIFFVSCYVCTKLPSVYNPAIAKYPKYIDPKKYSDSTRYLTYRFECPSNLATKQKFSITALKLKQMAKIRDIRELFELVFRVGSDIIISPPVHYHNAFSYNRELSDCKTGLTPFSSALARDPVLLALPETKSPCHNCTQPGTASVCHNCLLDLSRDAPPPYSPENNIADN